MLIDTHCHLEAPEFAADRDATIAACRAGGIAAIVVPAVAVANFAAVRELAHAHSGLGYALGIHPMYVDDAQDDDLVHLRRALEAARGDPRLVAVGEIGLDYFVPGLDHERQRRFLEAQLRLAAEFELPVLLHARRSQDHLLRELRRIRVSGGIAHAFNGSRQQAGIFLDLGFALGFGGAMTFDRATRIRALAAELPPEAHVLETDAPDMAPAWLPSGSRNSPAELPAIAAAFASLRGVPVADAIAATGANALRVLPRLRELVPGELA